MLPNDATNHRPRNHQSTGDRRDRTADPPLYPAYAEHPDRSRRSRHRWRAAGAEARIAELKIGNVILEGAKSQEAIIRAMQESDIFLLPSRLEGLPKVTLEAAASGLPCVVFRDYATPSVVDGISGFQVNTMDEMIEKLGLLINDAQLRESMGEAGRKLTEKFDWDIVARLWQDAYLEIASMAA